ncbi:MAG: TRAP transporter small permease [Burkholderiaceae bacterium]
MRFITAIEHAAAWLAAVLFVLTGLFLSYEVVARYFFNAPTIWAAELSQLCLIWGGLISMAWVLGARRHIRINAVTVRLQSRARAAAEAFSMAVVALFSAIVLWYGFGIAWDSLERGRTSGTMLDLPAWWAEAAVPVGFLMLLVVAVRECINALRGQVPETGAHLE